MDILKQWALGIDIEKLNGVDIDSPCNTFTLGISYNYTFPAFEFSLIPLKVSLLSALYLSHLRVSLILHQSFQEGKSL